MVDLPLDPLLRNPCTCGAEGRGDMSDERDAEEIWRCVVINSNILQAMQRLLVGRDLL